MSFEIQHATREQIPQIYNLLFKLSEYQHLSDEFKIDEKKLSEMIFDEKSVNALVSVEDDKVNGIALYYTSCVSTFSGKHILTLEDIFVDENARSKGVGRKFFEKLREIAKQNDCCKIEWKCQSWNINAGNFYKRMGSKQEDGWVSFSINHI